MRNKGASSKFDVKKEDRNNLIILLALGLVLRLYAFSQIYLISNDGAFQYIPVAKLFYQGEYLQALAQPQLPLYPFLISILTHITGSFELSGQLISIFFSLLAVFPLYLIGKSLFGPRPAFWTTILYLINPLMLHSSVDVLKESIVIFFFFSSVYYSLRFLHDGKRVWLFWTVVFAIVGAFSRMLTLEILLALGLWVGYGALRGRSHERKLAYRFLWMLILIVGICLILAMPGILGWEFLVTKKPYLKVVDEVFRRWFIYDWPSLSQIGEQFIYIVDRFIEKTYYIPLALAGVGLWCRLKDKEVSTEGLYLAFLMAVLIISFTPFLYASGRYHLPAIFLLYLWAGLGFVKIRELIERRFTRYPRLTAVIPIIILLGAMLSFDLQPQRLDKIDRKEVGLWLREQVLSPPLILTDDPRVAYYAGGAYVLIPAEAPPAEIVKLGMREKVDYLVLEGKGTGILESLAPFEKKGVLELILRHPYGHKGRVIYVYKIKRQ